MTNSESVRNEATTDATQEAPATVTDDNAGNEDNLSIITSNELTEALSKVMREVESGHRDSVEIPSEGLRKSDETDLVFGHYAAARWDKD
jgi:hypothetical protein